jgi:hypothetical protein
MRFEVITTALVKFQEFGALFERNRKTTLCNVALFERNRKTALCNVALFERNRKTALCNVALFERNRKTALCNVALFERNRKTALCKDLVSKHRFHMYQWRRIDFVLKQHAKKACGDMKAKRHTQGC